MDVVVRLLSEDDAPALARLLADNREHLAPWDALRPDEYATVDFQRAEAARTLERYRQGAVWPGVVVLDGDPVGRVNVNTIVRGAFQSGDLGYWLARSATGRGVATAAVAAVVRTAFGALSLHRLQAATLLHNTASQRVLEHNGFARIGMAPRYLRIAGRWQDHVLFQLLDDDRVDRAPDLR
ncbi:GNAT family N-acetyltransferase [Geodermatophilus sp. CPCC 206100]|uniref:GNAT family N-acetyltransferase n=1 Tax=Geodermatophilus sp. CPCC 206100 TaxID=3020054 RepID=UPI003B001FE6